MYEAMHPSAKKGRGTRGYGGWVYAAHLLRCRLLQTHQQGKQQGAGGDEDPLVVRHCGTKATVAVDEKEQGLKESRN